METPARWHTLPAESVFLRLSSRPTGLAESECSHRQAEYGPNELQAPVRASPWAMLVEQFRNVLVLILLAATALSAVLGHGLEALVIAIIVLFAVLLGFVQEYRAERAIEALREMAAPTATVLRDGEEVELPARELVPGDVIVLRAGDRVPADARVVEAVNLKLEEAALTGESLPVAKQVAPLADGQLPLVVLAETLRGAALCSDAHLARHQGRWRIKGDPTEGALVVAAAKAGLDKARLEVEAPRVGETPFTSESKRMSTLHAVPGGGLAYAKGAPEVILAASTSELTARGEHPLDTAGRERILVAAQAMAGDALRVLAVARQYTDSVAEAEGGLSFLGLVGMSDPPRPEARDAIATCVQAGIKPVMITGDHPLTAQAVARELGLLSSGRAVTGSELEALSEAELERKVEEIDVYARVSPAHKLRVVRALQGRGHVVAMTGDGVNDAPALKKADIGVAMGITGTDVSKEAAAMTLTDDNFASIVAAVEEGRGIFGNIKKYLMYLLSSNIGEIGLMAGSVLLGLPLPLTAVQILYVNLATDGLPSLALAVDPPESDLLERPPRDPRGGIFTRPVVVLMLAGGIWSTLVNLGLFAWALGSGRSLAEAMTMTFVALVLIQFFKAYNYRSDRHSVLRRPFANKWLNLAILWELILLAGIVYLPFLHEPFGTFSLPLVDWLIIVGLSLTISPVLELVKWMERRGWFGTLR